MKYIVEGGTDAGSMLLFDPEALPDNYDSIAKIDPTNVLETATLNGDAYWINTDGDGAYLLHAFVDEPVTAELTACLRDPEELPQFRVPSGKLYFAGMEYGFRSDDSLLKKYSGMGAVMDLEHGCYTFALYRTEYPEDLAEEKLRTQVSPLAFRLHQAIGTFVVFSLLGLACLVLSFFLKSLALYLLPIGVLLFVLPLVVTRLPLYQKTDLLWTDIQRMYPSFVLILKKNPPKPSSP